jgi:uncharacterized protein
MNIDDKIKKIEGIVKDKKVILAFSGGADSTLVGYLSKKTTKKILAITFNNGLMPSTFLKDSQDLAEAIGINQIIVEDDFLKNDNFTKNTSNRCFICRNIMYTTIKKIAKEKNFDMIVDGTNISDLLEDRPGIMVNYENDVVSPLVIVGMEKDEVLKILKENNINYSKSTTCLSTRISVNDKITPKKINRIRYGENLLKTIVKSNRLRVRDVNDTAQIEVEDIGFLLNKKTLKLIENELKAIGFKKVLLNIESQTSLKKELVIYKPCKDETNKIMFENDLPYIIDIAKTCLELEKIGKVKCSHKMGVAMLDIEGKNITLFEKGKIVARKVENKEDAHKILVKILPLIRREI